MEGLPAQDPEWLAAREELPVGVGENGVSRQLRIDMKDNDLGVDQSGSDGPGFSAKLVFNGFVNGSMRPPDVLIETVLLPGKSLTDSFRRIENPPEKTVKALCQGFYLALTNQTPIGTEANPLDRIESGEAAGDLDNRMDIFGYKQAMSVTRGMFRP